MEAGVSELGHGLDRSSRNSALLAQIGSNEPRERVSGPVPAAPPTVSWRGSVCHESIIRRRWVRSWACWASYIIKSPLDRRHPPQPVGQDPEKGIASPV